MAIQPSSPFYWPGRARERMRMVPPAELRPYRVRLQRWCSPTVVLAWLAIGWAVLFGWIEWSPLAGEPLLIVVALSASLTVVALLASIHFDTRRLLWMVAQDHPHLCRHCGYDRSVTSARCPECGVQADAVAD